MNQNLKPNIAPHEDTGRDPGARAEHAYVKERKPKDEEVFIVRQVSGARKRKAADIEEPAPPEPLSANEVETTATNGAVGDAEPHEISLHGTEEEQTTREKAERKAERKAQKKLEKKRRKLEEQKSSQENGMGDEAAFDYANAPSVLHAKEAPHKRLGAKEIFNPYSKSFDAPKGLGDGREKLYFQKLSGRGGQASSLEEQTDYPKPSLHIWGGQPISSNHSASGSKITTSFPSSKRRGLGSMAGEDGTRMLGALKVRELTLQQMVESAVRGTAVGLDGSSDVLLTRK